MLDEIERGVDQYPELAAVIEAEWLDVVRTDDLDVLRCLAEYVRLLSAGPRNLGECTVLAWCEAHGGVAVIDDGAGRNAGDARDVRIRGTLRLIAAGYRAGQLNEQAAIELVDALRDAEAWFPCNGSEFFDWARSQQLL